jgi:hypothetical protein
MVLPGWRRSVRSTRRKHGTSPSEGERPQWSSLSRRHPSEPTLCIVVHAVVPCMSTGRNLPTRSQAFERDGDGLRLGACVPCDDDLMVSP